jgi:CheY-like chemotaxis protein
MHLPRILVADDNSNIQKMVTLAFQGHGIEVIAVGNGEAAVRKMLDVNPDVVLADVFMPVRNGYELCEYIKKDSRYAKIPVILLVGAFDPLDEAEARRVGADGILKKPFVPPEPLIAMVTAVMAKSPKVEPKAAAPEIEIPKPPPPRPPPVIETFPELTAEEEAHMFGIGRRSLDDDEGLGGGRSTQTVVAPAAASTETMAEDEAGFEGTNADWRRRDQVNSDDVPSFAPSLTDELTGRNLSPRESEMQSLAVDRAPEAAMETQSATAESMVEIAPALGTAISEELQPESPSNESFLRAFTGAFADAPSATETVEPPATSLLASQDAALAGTFHESTGLAEMLAPALAISRDWESGARTEVVQDAVEVPVAEEPPSQEIQVETASVESNSAVGSVEVPVDDALPIPSSAPEAPASEFASVEAAPTETAALLPWEALRAPVESVVAEIPALRADPEPQAAIQAQDAAPWISEPTVVPAESFAGESPTAEIGHVAVFEEVRTEEPEVLSAPVEILESTEIVARQIGGASISETPIAELGEPELSPVNTEAQAAVPAAETVAEVSGPPEVSEFAHATSPEHVAEAVPEPSASSTASPAETAAPAAAPAPAGPTVDELVAKVLEKLGPQLQELLSRNLVRPLVEDMLKKPGDEKK